MTSDQMGILGLIVMLTPVVILCAYVVYDYLKSNKTKIKKS